MVKGVGKAMILIIITVIIFFRNCYAIKNPKIRNENEIFVLGDASTSFCKRIENPKPIFVDTK